MIGQKCGVNFMNLIFLWKCGSDREREREIKKKRKWREEKTVESREKKKLIGKSTLTVLILIRLREQQHRQHNLSVIMQYRKKSKQTTNKRLASMNEAE